MYVNGECKDETPLGRLMQDFSCTDPENMNYQALADRTGYFKRDEKGVNIMCRLLEDMRMEAMEEGRMEGRIEGKKVGKAENKSQEHRQKQKYGEKHQCRSEKSHS